MPLPTLSAAQSALAARPADHRIFLEGIAGTGKTVAGVARLLGLLGEATPAESILVIVPQRTLATPYTDALRDPAVPAGGEATVLTVGGLAQRMIELFWPLVAAPAGFARPERPPVFLTLETAQYFMARLVAPLLDAGYFDSVRIERNRLYSQILDNLNKAAVVGFPHTEIGGRLHAAWIGESAQARVYDEAQACAARFREYCLAHNLLDFSLQYEIFVRHLWPLPACRRYLTGRYTHLIADNIEEDTPVAHDLLAEWLPACRSALAIYDWEAGYRRFLGADPEGAYRLKTLCEEHVTFTESFVTAPDVKALAARLGRALGGKRGGEPEPAVMGPRGARRVAEELPFDALRTAAPPVDSAALSGDAPDDPRPALDFASHRYHPEMLDWVADEIGGLVHDRGVAPGEIAVLAPFLGGGLLFSLANRLAARAVPVRAHRPSRALREEPVTLCLLTLAALAHPAWGIRPGKFDVAYALTLAIDGMDLVRAQLLADIVYRTHDGLPVLGLFSDIEPAMQERITFLLGGRYEGLRTWLAANSGWQRTDGGGQRAEGHAREGESSLSDATRSAQYGRGKKRKARGAELDHFLGRLFGELLSQPGYGFHRDYPAGEITANIIESARKFRQVTGPTPPSPLPFDSLRAGSAREGGALPSPGRGGAGGEVELSREYVELVREGVVAAQYVRSWQRQPADAVLLAPAYTFLMANRPVEHQFWLDVGSTGWWERLNQPLTHPYVLSRGWPAGRPWTDAEEYAARQAALYALVMGLVRRCRTQIHLGLSELGEQGVEQRGPLSRALQQMLREL